MANERLNTLIDNVRSMDNTFPGEVGDTVGIVSAVVGEKLVELTGADDDTRIEAALAVLALVASRATVLHQTGEISEELHEFALDLSLEFSMALCRLHS